VSIGIDVSEPQILEIILLIRYLVQIKRIVLHGHRAISTVLWGLLHYYFLLKAQILSSRRNLDFVFLLLIYFLELILQK
jgi:hypothetical protein